MSEQRIQIADKPTLDKVLQNTSDIKSNMSMSNISGGGIECVSQYIAGGVILGSNTKVSTLPYDFYQGSAVVLNNEIHILGGYSYSSNSSYGVNHYKWNGSSWVKVSTLPYNFYRGSAVVLNNEIHILGGNSNNHYKWDGSSWIKVSTLPYDFYYGSAVVLNNEIHILGSYNSNCYKYHYKWNGSSWINVSTLPYNFYDGGAVVLNNEIHILRFTDHYEISDSRDMICLYMKEGNIILCDTNAIKPVSNNLEAIDNGYLCNSTGLCKFYTTKPKESSIYTII